MLYPAEDAGENAVYWRGCQCRTFICTECKMLQRTLDPLEDAGRYRGRWYSDRTLDRKLDAAEVAEEDAEQDAGSYS